MTNSNDTLMPNIRQSNVSNDMDCLINGELPELIKPGEYEMTLCDYRTDLFFGKAPKLVMSFKILDLGEAFEMILPKYYNILEIMGKSGGKGAFKVGKRSDFLRDFSRLFPHVNIRGLDRFPISYFQGVIIRGVVTTVTHDAKQHLIPKSLQYSKVSKLLRVVSCDGSYTYT